MEIASIDDYFFEQFFSRENLLTVLLNEKLKNKDSLIRPER